MTALETLNSFDEQSLPDLDTVVLGALEFFTDITVPELSFTEFERPLVVGSANAAAVGKLLFSHTPAVFADESSFEEALKTHDVDALVVISASGGKHAVGVVNTGVEEQIPTFLITNNIDAPAGKLLESTRMQVLPKVREPYTYNISTYLGMLLAAGRERAEDILAFINGHVAPDLPETFGNFDAFFLTVPGELEDIRPMLRTKFDELFGPKVVGRVFTHEEAKHAKTVVPSDKEYFISFGEANTQFGAPERRINIALPENAGPAALMTIGYFVIGRIQAEHPPFFSENIAAYCAQASEMFGQTITPIVE